MVNSAYFVDWGSRVRIPPGEAGRWPLSFCLAALGHRPRRVFHASLRPGVIAVTPSAALYYANYYAPLPGVKEGIVQDGEPGTPACEKRAAKGVFT